MVGMLIKAELGSQTEHTHSIMSLRGVSSTDLRTFQVPFHALIYIELDRNGLENTANKC